MHLSSDSAYVEICETQTNIDILPCDHSLMQSKNLIQKDEFI